MSKSIDKQMNTIEIIWTHDMFYVKKYFVYKNTLYTKEIYLVY